MILNLVDFDVETCELRKGFQTKEELLELLR